MMLFSVMEKIPGRLSVFPQQWPSSIVENPAFDFRRNARYHKALT